MEEIFDSTHENSEDSPGRTWQTSLNFATIGQALRSAPILRLHSDIMHNIFQLVVKNSWCIENNDLILQALKMGNPLNRSTKYPELLSHVCSLWRRVIVNSPRYWTHIDLFPFHKFGEAILNRAATFAARACHLPLELHIFNIMPPSRANIAKFFDFLSMSMPQTSSLTVVTRYIYYTSYAQILESCFRSAISGKLLRLSMSEVILEDDQANYDFDHTFLESIEDRRDAESLGLDVPRAMLEDVWRSVTVLRTSWLCPRWSSQAYSGLADLRLTHVPDMSRYELANLLASSPRLRILQLAINIWSAGEQHDEPYVRLDQLEVLDLGGVWLSALEAVLSVFRPGSKPLQFVVQPPDPSDTRHSQTQALLKDFLTSSNITMLYMLSLPSCSWLEELPVLAPQLDTLIINRCTPGLQHSLASTLPSNGQVLRLKELYIVHIYVDLDDIIHILRICPADRLALGHTRVYQAGGEPLNTVELRDHLSHLCSSLWLLDLLDEKDVPIEAEIDDFSLLRPI